MLGLFTKAPVFLVNALREWTGSVGEALRLPSSLLPSPLCEKQSSSPLRAENNLSIHTSLVLLLGTTGITSYQPAARRVGYILKMCIGSVRRLGRNQHHPTLLPSIQHLRKHNNATFEMLNMENCHLRFSFFFLSSRIHFRMTSPSCLMLAPQRKNFLFHRSSDNDLNIFG